MDVMARQESGEPLGTEVMEIDSVGPHSNGSDSSKTEDYKELPVPRSVEEIKAAKTDSNGDESQKSTEEFMGCYCGKDRNFKVPELQCGWCMRWFHQDCISCYIGNCIPLMTNYQFICKNCSPNNQESFTKKQASFSQMCQTAVANLHAQIPDRRKFSKDHQIIPFIDKHWESLTTMPRRIKLTWHNTVSKTMMNYPDIFLCEEVQGGDQLFGLVNPDVSKIGPNYDSLKAALGLTKQDIRTGGNSQDVKSRSSKRKAPEAQTALGSKQKRGDSIASTKLAPHGYPLEHPFNKDGYRYHLAESDPHAPGRQAFDDSIEWAGKPIPGYLYRVFLGSEVLLALHDRAPQLKITDDRLTVTGDKGYSMVRATHGVNRGSWYYEITVTELPPDTGTRLGWSQVLGNLQAPCGYDKWSYSWRSRKGTRFHQSHGKHYSDAYSEGDVLGFYIHLPDPNNPNKFLPVSNKDKPLVKFKNNLYYEEKDSVSEAERNLKTAEKGEIIFYKNGVSQGLAWTDIYEGTYYPAMSLYKNSTVTVNFGPDFKYPPTDLPDYQPISEVASLAMIENALGDIIFHIENEGNIPDFC